MFRLHTSACDRAAAVALLRELLELMGGGRANMEEIGKGNEEKGVELSLGIEDLIPSGKANKPFWVRGVDMLGYSLNSFRLANLNFVDANSARRSQVVRLQMNPDETDRLVAVSDIVFFSFSLLFKLIFKVKLNRNLQGCLVVCVFPRLSPTASLQHCKFEIFYDYTVTSHNFFCHHQALKWRNLSCLWFN